MDFLKDIITETAAYDGCDRSWSIWLCSSYIWGRNTELLYYLGGNDLSKDRHLSFVTELAEHMNAVLVIPHPLAGGWNTSAKPGSADDISFLNQLYYDTTNWLLDGYSTLSAKRYLIGREQGTSISALWLATSPLNFTAAYLHAPKNLPAGINPLKLDIDNPLPLWLDGCPDYQDNEIVRFWKMVNQAGILKADDVFPGSSLYLNPDEDAHRIYVSAASYMKCSSDYIRLYDHFFNRIRRWRYNHNRGITQWSPEDSEMGLTFHQQVVAGYERSWYCHIPDLKEKPDEGFPILFAYHGMKTDGKYYLEQSEWYKIALEYKFILIAPNGYNNAWNADENPNLPDDCQFTQVLLEWVGKRAAVDQNRIFAIGFSLGGAMVNRLLVHLPFLFAGGCAKSGQLYDTNVLRDSVRESGRVSYSVQRTDLPVPMWQIMGETEAYDEYMGDEYISTAYWIKAAHASFLPTACRLDYDVYSTRIYEGLLSQYRFTYIKGIGHACYPDESRLIWEQFFGCLRRANEQVLKLQGAFKDTEITLSWELPKQPEGWTGILVTAANGRQFPEQILSVNSCSASIPISQDEDYEHYHIWVVPILHHGLSRGYSEIIISR